jgi:hypothetical protein
MGSLFAELRASGVRSSWFGHQVRLVAPSTVLRWNDPENGHLAAAVLMVHLS